ncbi:MAG: type II toxin-antitoxin system RelE/ParE family toxin [Kiritimatiellaeota bacterium]|nr:type II toxin-antitoxin system RelE/ParE family toxin [Kiritimatiellota bacterium]
MAKYKILLTASAAKELEALPKPDRLRIIERIKALGDNPRRMGCEKLIGEEKYRVRQGVYRILYAIHDDIITVVVVKIGHRREVYR